MRNGLAMVAQSPGAQFENRTLRPLLLCGLPEYLNVKVQDAPNPVHTDRGDERVASFRSVRLELRCVHEVGLTFLIIVKQASLSARMLSQRIYSWLSGSREMALLDRSI